MCGMTHSYVWHDSFICVTWLIYTCGMTHSYVWHDSFICVAWLIHMCGMTHLYVCHDSSICVPWLIHMCGMTHSYVWHDSFIHVTWLLYMCATSHVTRTNPPRTYIWVTSHTCMRRMTSYASVVSHISTSHVTRTNPPRTSIWVTSHTCMRWLSWYGSVVSHTTHSYAITWLIHRKSFVRHNLPTWHHVSTYPKAIMCRVLIHMTSRDSFIWNHLRDTTYPLNIMCLCAKRRDSDVGSWRIRTCNMTRWHVRHDLSIWNQASYACVRRDSYIGSWRIHMCDMSRWHVRHDLSIWNQASYACVRRDSYIGSWRIHMCDMSCGTHIKESCHMYEWEIKRHMHVRDVTHIRQPYEWARDTWWHMDKSCRT